MAQDCRVLCSRTDVTSELELEPEPEPEPEPERSPKVMTVRDHAGVLRKQIPPLGLKAGRVPSLHSARDEACGLSRPQDEIHCFLETVTDV